MSYEFDWVDAFTETPFGGNACMVVHGAEALPVEERLALVRETSLSECAYLVSSDKADFGARYYLADREILMAGHPTIATVVSLILRGLTGGRTEFTLEAGAGVLPIRVVAEPGRPPLIVMRQPAPVFGRRWEPAAIAALYGLAAGDVLGVPRTVSTGTAFCVTLVRDHDTLRLARLDAGALAAMERDFFEPFLVALGGATPAGRTFARLLLPPPLPAEDPFTGSATGCMAAYLWAEGLIETPDFVAEQGHWLGRPGAARVRVLGPRDAIEGVEVGGRGVVLMQGRLRL
ncbi:MAG TPA: PhzF family phenazine biosynthesis protein [Paracoccaceae bacterium]|nr:PhzF family phenazine biosynthesis protein [Paracoccaceae bacterium]